MAARGRGVRRGRRARYAVRDWAAYDRALARRGDITVWVSPDAVAAWREPKGRRTFSDAAIAAVLTARAVLRLALRQAEGLIASVFALLGLALPVPDHTTLSRRGRALDLDRRADAGRGLDLAIDSTGLHVARPRGVGCEGWRKLHIAVDPDSGQIVAEELTRSDVHDTVPVPPMLGRIAGRVGRVYGDGAYAGGPTHRAVAERRQALPNAEGVFRPKASDVRAAATLDPLTGRGRHARHVAREGRAAWERATGYGRRNAAEWTFSRLKRVLGGGLRSRGLDAQSAEASIAVRALNRMAALGLPRAERVA
jgi:Transposase DDE domain